MEQKEFKFSRNNKIYSVKFNVYKKKDIEIKNELDKNNLKYSIKFGLINKEKNKVEYKKTNLFQQYHIFRCVLGIVENFIFKNNIEVLNYNCDKKLRNICKYIFNKYFINQFNYLEVEKNNKFNVFIVKK